MTKYNAITVTFEMDWKENATKDFSFVVWSKDPVSIKSNLGSTKAST